jgi:hypothetical protein
MVRIGARIAPFAIAALVVAGIAPAAASAHEANAHARPSVVGDLAGYLWSPLEPLYDFNGEVGSITSTKVSTGDWNVTLDDLGAMTGGMVHVTPYDADGTCAVGSWKPTGSNLTVNVRCYSLSGHPASMLFDLLVAQPTTPPAGVFDYAFVYRDTNTGALTGRYQYSTAHKIALVKHLGTGRYQLTFPGSAPAGTKGVVKVSAYGAGAGDCQTSGWTGGPSRLVVGVDCYTAAGKPVNRKFDVTYVSRTNLMGPGFATVNAYISAAGHVQAQVDSLPKAHVAVVHTKTGLYTVNLNGTPESGGDVQISPVNSRDEHCVVDSWEDESTSTAVFVSCFDNKGHPVNSGFTLEFVAAFLV